MEFGDGLSPEAVERVVREWLREDIPAMDVGGMVVGSGPGEAVLWIKGTGVVCGRPFVDAVFAALGCAVSWSVREGQRVEVPAGGRVEAARVTGPTNRLLQGERSALNCLARTSGIATACAELVAAARAGGWGGRVAGTRKTTPGFRLCEKYAMLVGGCDTHRFDLSSMCMLKDNHVAAHGSIAAAVARAREAAGFAVKIEVECGGAAEGAEAAEAGADVVMLDNLSGERLWTEARALRQAVPHRRFLIEASGGITAATLPLFLCPDVDVISLGSVTQGHAVVDFSLKIQKKHKPL